MKCVTPSIENVFFVEVMINNKLLYTLTHLTRTLSHFANKKGWADTAKMTRCRVDWGWDGNRPSWPASFQHSLTLSTSSRVQDAKKHHKMQVHMNRIMTIPAKRHLLPAKTQISLGIPRMKKYWVVRYPLSALRRLWSDWADAQADLESSLGAHAILLVLSWGCSYNF